jgi:hypothetical protein
MRRSANKSRKEGDNIRSKRLAKQAREGERKLARPDAIGGSYKPQSRKAVWGNLPQRPVRGSQKYRLVWELQVFQKAHERRSLDTFPRIPERWDHEERILYSALPMGAKISESYLRSEIEKRKRLLETLEQ